MERYANGDFLDLEHDNGWSIETATVSIDYDLLAQLDGTKRSAGADIENSLCLYKALRGMTPAMALEERIWVRLTHIECLRYARDRWLAGSLEELDKQVRLHMFAPGLTSIRDDNALSRLWWNMHIASIADPADPEGALRLILKSADIRSNFVERTGTATRRPLARALIRAMRDDPWITSSERAFREFMKALNRNGGGVLSEAIDDARTDELMKECSSRAQAHMEAVLPK
ncbi:DUF6339 family protein [Marinobacterium rhizophilum]|uniref:DUF6339 family protein n=1 Tax=Marinobacterium rhizophilum TaxID=420402 RepID=UPI001969F871|nr:DUF6339 family protein [Marinobacterium rhizophilum]